MLRNDKKILKNLIEEYGMLEVISALSHLASDLADDCSDLGLKNRAIAYIGASDKLKNVKENLTDADL